MIKRGNIFEMNTEEYKEYEDEYSGLCLACGKENLSVEPDAERYECDSCGKHSVYGIMTLMIAGRIQITE